MYDGPPFEQTENLYEIIYEYLVECLNKLNVFDVK